MNSYQSIQVPTIIAENMLISKYFPIALEKNPELIEQSNNAIRVIKRYALGYDLILNLIHTHKKRGNFHIYDFGENDYLGKFNKSDIENYFAKSPNSDIRKSLIRQLELKLNTGFIKVNKFDKKRGFIVRNERPFSFHAYEKAEKEQSGIIEILFSKTVFEPIINNTHFCANGGGYIKLPTDFFPTITGINLSTRASKDGETGQFEYASHNPFYKLNVLGLLRRKEKKTGSITTDVNDFMMNVIPEYTQEKNGKIYLKGNIERWEVHSLLSKGMQVIREKFHDHVLVKNIYIDWEKDKAIIYFTNQ